MESCHHPFTAPVFEDMHLLEQCSTAQGVVSTEAGFHGVASPAVSPEAELFGPGLLSVRGQHYDLVLNGV